MAINCLKPLPQFSEWYVEIPLKWQAQKNSREYRISHEKNIYHSQSANYQNQLETHKKTSRYELWPHEEMVGAKVDEGGSGEDQLSLIKRVDHLRCLSCIYFSDKRPNLVSRSKDFKAVADVMISVDGIKIVTNEPLPLIRRDDDYLSLAKRSLLGKMVARSSASVDPH